MKKLIAIMMAVICLVSTMSMGVAAADGVNPFLDVEDGAYYYDAVLWAVEKGITHGTSDTTFSPDETCTRAQVVTFLWRAAGEPAATGENPFADVSEDAYYYDAVLWAVENGITKGTAEAVFSPDEPCIRAQVVTFMWRAMGNAVTEGKNPFGDVYDSVYYYAAVIWAAANKITEGTADGAFSPDATCTRGQIVTFLYRAMGGELESSVHFHEYSVTETVEPKCFEDGYELMTCSCGASYKKIMLRYNDHDMEQTDYLEPTYTEFGYEEFTCTRCGEVVRNQIDKLEEPIETPDPEPDVEVKWCMMCGSDDHNTSECTNNEFIFACPKCGADISDDHVVWFFDWVCETCGDNVEAWQCHSHETP